jgi:cold shock CspA family protein
MIGIVQQFNEIKGFGFLLKNFKTKVFFHVSAWNSDIPPQPKMKVTFDLTPSHKPGMPDQATNVMPLESNVGGAL